MRWQFPKSILQVQSCSNTISLIIHEVCDAIKAEFVVEGIQCPTSTEEWISISEQFEKNGNFHTVVLRWMQACGSYMSWEHWLHVQKLQRFILYCPYGLSRCRLQVFLWIDVGSDDSSKDASIYNGSELKEGLQNPNNPFHLPEDKLLPGDDVPVPYFIIGDNAFGINKALMNPFCIRNMDYHERRFNYRLSRARRVEENAFGILAHKFNVLLTIMNQIPKTCRKIIATCVILHNLIRLRYPTTHNNLMDLKDQNQDVIPWAWRNDSTSGCLP